MTVATAIVAPAKQAIVSNPAAGMDWITMVLSLLFVIACIIALGRLIKKFQERSYGSYGSDGAMRVRQGLSVGPRDKILLVEANGQLLLIGVSQSGMRTLHHYGDAPQVEKKDSSVSQFERWLKRGDAA